MQIEQLAGPGCGRRFEKEYINKYRDCVTFYYDGKVRFERFCYGEGACFVYGVNGSYENGCITYEEPLPELAEPSALPHELTGNDGDILYFDGARWKWEPVTQLAIDPDRGYTRFKMLLAKRKRK